jgi:hypothetical protein
MPSVLFWQIWENQFSKDRARDASARISGQPQEQGELPRRTGGDAQLAGVNFSGAEGSDK